MGYLGTPERSLGMARIGWFSRFSSTLQFEAKRGMPSLFGGAAPPKPEFVTLPEMIRRMSRLGSHQETSDHHETSDHKEPTREYTKRRCTRLTASSERNRLSTS